MLLDLRFFVIRFVGPTNPNKYSKQLGPEVKSVQKELQKHGLGTEERLNAAICEHRVQDHHGACFSKATYFKPFLNGALFRGLTLHG